MPMPVLADDDVRWPVEAAPGRVAQLGVVVERDDPQRRRDHDAGATPFEERGKLVSAPVGRDSDREPFEFRHASATSTTPSLLRTP
jgi:hypothetical protein